MKEITVRFVVALLLLSGFGTVVHAASGPDYELQAETPSVEPVRAGLAGDPQAGVARYLLARGAQSAALSPDGQHAAFLYSATGTDQLWLTSVTGGQPRQLTFGNGVSFFRWAPDSNSLIYGADNNGDERPAYFQLSVDGATERLLLPATEQGFRAFGSFAPDGKSVFYASTERNGDDYDVYRADVASGEVKRLFEGTFDFRPYTASANGRHLIVTEAVGEDGDNLYLLDLASLELNTLSAPEPRASHTSGFPWRADSSGFFFASNRGREFMAIYFHDVSSGKDELVVSGEVDYEQVRLCNSEQQLLWLANHDGFSKLHVMDLATGASRVSKSLPDGVYSLSCSATNSTALVRVSSWSTPGALWTLNVENDQALQIFKPTLAGLDPESFVRPESVRMVARDGVELQGLLYLPHKVEEATPVLFFVHGGPTSQSRADFSGVIQYHLSRGLAVFEPNVRGSTGFGRTYTALDDRRNRLNSVRDLVDMLDHFETDPRVDAKRAAVIGGSYGGYAVNAVLAAYPERFKVGVSLFGVADWVTALEVASPSLKASDRIEYGDIREPEWRQFYMVESPIRQADQIRVPVLYSHGVMDPRIDISETEIMVKTLRENGIEAPYIRIPDEGHGWRKLRNRIFYFTRESEFIEKHLQCPPEQENCSG